MIKKVVLFIVLYLTGLGIVYGGTYAVCIAARIDFEWWIPVVVWSFVFWIYAERERRFGGMDR